MNESGAPQTGRFHYLLLWLPILLALLVLGWLIESRRHDDATYVAGAQWPMTEETARHFVTVLNADRAGHYVFRGMINGREVTFLLDTGASTVAIPEQLASYLGLSYGQEFIAHTANGSAKAYMSRLRSVKVGNIEQTDVMGSILPGMQGDAILLGMSFLKHLSMVQNDGTIRLEQPRTAQVQ